MYLTISLFIIVILALFYATLWLFSFKKYPVEYGISFNKSHAESLGLDWQETYLAMLNDLKPKYIRISANWDEIEKNKNEFDTEYVDWMMFEAGKRNVAVVLVVGQKSPRWPECHVPDWTKDLSESEYKKELLNYVDYVVQRYRNHPTLDIWQVENEAFIKFQFGECQRFDKSVVKDEIDLVHELDKNHKVMITDSGELSTWHEATKAGDIFGTTVYRVVMTPGGIYWKYDWLPAGFYKLKYKFWFPGDKPFMASELQAEPWFTGDGAQNTSIAEQEKSMNPKRLKKHFDFVEHMGVSRAYLWGVEWWYWMKEAKGIDDYWNLVREKINS